MLNNTTCCLKKTCSWTEYVFHRYMFSNILRWGWVSLERTQIRSGIQFTRNFIEFVLLETNQFVGSNFKRDLDTANKRPTLEHGRGKQRLSASISFFHTNLLYFPISKCRQQPNLDLWTTSVRAKRLTLSIGEFRWKMCLAAKFVVICQRAAACSLQVPKLCTDLDLSLLYILILWTYSKFEWKNKILVPSLCFPKQCFSAGRMFAASRSRLYYHRRIVSFAQEQIEWNAW